MHRNLFQSLVRHLDKREFAIITGARQTGKSTLMRQLEAHCKAEQIPSLFFNLENKALLADFDHSPLSVLPYLPDTDKRMVIFVDEVQYLHDPSNFLKLLYDEYVDKIKIVATGSSAFYLDNSFRDSLAGRKKIFRLPTCSFDEYLALRERQDLLDDIRRIQSDNTAKSLYINVLQQEWATYMIYGGYPAIITENDRKEKSERLAEIRDSFVKRDILEAGVKNEKAFYQLFRILASQSGSLFNVNELSLSLKIKNDTVNHYLNVLQKCFLINSVHPFYRNLRKELTKMPKIYLSDTGLLNSLLNNFQPPDIRADKGVIWETVCYKTLCDRYGSDEVLFWRTSDGNEVDLVLPNIENPFAVEVKYDEARIKAGKYKKFIENYPDIPLSYNYLVPFTEDFFRRNKILQ
ncbi:MAG: ATP-binding protein [Prevotellaceae bacterium]|jgi:predicted AAA+ superfamily ATPase|nr:ATP-binding protein [Prevotellaceae bacterium]